MSWIQQNANLYINSDAPFSLQYIGSSWYLIDNRDQSKAIPFSDIFNNPVFSIDLSLADVLVKSLSATNAVSGAHLRSETANTPSTPGHSFKGEISSGFYRESAGVMAFSSLGNKVLNIDSVPSFLTKAWVNFNAVGTVSIRGSGNISSITDNNTGDFTLNFTTAMVDTNYISIGSGQEGSGYAEGTVFVRIGLKSTSDVRISVANFTQTALQDVARNDIIILR